MLRMPKIPEAVAGKIGETTHDMTVCRHGHQSGFDFERSALAKYGNGLQASQGAGSLEPSVGHMPPRAMHNIPFLGVDVVPRKVIEKVECAIPVRHRSRCTATVVQLQDDLSPGGNHRHLYP